MTNNVKRIIELDQKHDLGLCHGLAPNPWGFTFEATGKIRIDKLVNNLLNNLSNEETKQLINYMRGN